MFICNKCGANMKFDPQEGRLKCDYCGNIIDDDDEQLKLINAEKGKYYDAVVYKCPQCGAELLTTDETVATFCNYCGSSVLIKEKTSKPKKPDCVIPFSISKEQCEKLYKKKLNKAWFAPKHMKEKSQIEKMHGIYMPYWVYDFKKNGKLNFKGEKSYRAGDYIKTDVYQISANIDGKYEGIPFDSSSTFYDSISQSISNYDLNNVKEFKEHYLSGFYVDAGDIDSSVYEDNAQEIIEPDIKKKIEKQKSLKHLKLQLEGLTDQFSNIKRIGYFPIWFLGTKTTDGKYISYAAINGHTGKISAELPIDTKKYFVVLILLATILFFALNTFLTLTPPIMLLADLIISIIALIILNKNYNQIYRKENFVDDEGMQSVSSINYNTSEKEHKNIYYKITAIFLIILIMAMLVCVGLIDMYPQLNQDDFIFIIFALIVTMFAFIPILCSDPKEKVKQKSEIKAPIKEKLPKLLLPIYNIAIIILTFIIYPVDDMLYYISAILSIILLLLSAINIVKSHNLLTTRKLPQLEKRGGDIDE